MKLSKYCSVAFCKQFFEEANQALDADEVAVLVVSIDPLISMCHLDTSVERTCLSKINHPNTCTFLIVHK